MPQLHLFILSLFMRLLKLDQFRCRSLTAMEIQLCQSVFGNLIDYSQVKVMNHPYLPWQPQHIFMAPCGYIHVRNRHYLPDYSQANRSYQAIFIHEMAHILQHQHHINVLLRGAVLQTAYFLSFKRYNPYHYRLIEAKPFFAYNIEQQGEIAKDIFLKKIDNIILNSPHRST